MLDLAHELRGIVGALDTAGARCALAGGLSVSIYSTPRATQDIDLLLAVADLDRATAVPRDLGFQIAGRPMAVARGSAQDRADLEALGPDTP